MPHRAGAPPPWLSLVIPAWNEEPWLPGLLDSVATARAAAARGAEVEVVVADNVSTDATAAVARARGCRVTQLSKRVIGAVRNAGAAAARGDVLAFIDADSRIHPRTFDVVAATLADPRVIAGATGVRFERWSAGIAATWAVGAALAALSGLDAGVVFCRRADFAAIGGYSESRLFAEDVQLLLDLRRRGKARGQRLARPRGAPAVTSARKFDRHGDWHALRLTLHTLARIAVSRWRGRRSRREIVDAVARGYWYEDRLSPPAPRADAPPGPPRAG